VVNPHAVLAAALHGIMCADHPCLDDVQDDVQLCEHQAAEIIDGLADAGYMICSDADEGVITINFATNHKED
jgi:hypothetical protein